MRALRLLLAGALSIFALVAIGTGSVASGGTSVVHFGPAVYVDQHLAGGEPEVIADTMHGTLVYTSHEGTTHIYRNGLVESPWGTFDFVSNYCNQVNIWTSTDGGFNWIRDRYLGATCPTPPANNTGFSDPDLTFDSGGRLYNTGINLVNDALFSSTDGGRTWNKGTAFCHDGDRPWLAGGRSNEVFMGTDPVEDNLDHRVFISTDGGNSCTKTGIPDFGTDHGMHYTGFGKLYWNNAKTKLAEPTVYTDSNGSQVGLGVSTWTRGKSAFTPHFVTKTKLFGFFPVMTVDSANNMYIVWTPDARQPGTHGGCDGNLTPAPNSVKYAYSRDWGSTWSAPITITNPNHARAIWPWAVGGDAGKVSFVWYQTAPGELPDNDCQSGHIYVKEATVFNAASANHTWTVVSALSRAVHVGMVCQGGTTCVATGQDRRLGDYFTNAIDARGCLMIATGDTRLKDPTTGADYPTSRPLFIKQDAGPKLKGTGTC
jgi:hypothetical protein